MNTPTYEIIGKTPAERNNLAIDTNADIDFLIERNVDERSVSGDLGFSNLIDNFSLQSKGKVFRFSLSE